MRVLVFGCERHVFNQLKRQLDRHAPPTPALNVPAYCEIEAVLGEFQPTHIIAGSEDLSATARETVGRLGMASNVYPLKTPDK